jgi:MFS family permease
VTAIQASASTVSPDAELRRTLVIVGGIVCFETVLYSILAPLLPRLADRFDLSKTAAGTLVAMYAAGAFLGSLPSGIAAARFGTKATALGGLVLLAGASVLFAFSPDAVWLFVARLLQGVGCALAWTGGLAWLLGRTPVERRGRVMGAALAAAVAGALLGPALGGLAGSVGTRAVFTGLAVPALALTAAGFAVRGAPAEPFPSPGRLARAFAGGSLLFAALMIGLAGFLAGVLSVLAPLHLAQLGWTTAGVGAIFLLAAGVNTGLTALLGRWSDSAGRATPLRTVLALCLCSAVLLTLAPGRWTYAAIVFAGACAFQLLWMPAMVLLSDASDDHGLGFVAGFALMNLSWTPGLVVGSVFAGAVAQATSDAVPFLICGGLCVAALRRVSA